MRVMMSGGGTGGHIYPALTIVRAMEQLGPCEILFVGTQQGLEADIIPKEGFRLELISVKGFERRLSWANIKNLCSTAGSVWRSMQLIREFKPDIVIGTGGYVCGPVLLAASLLGIPTMIQEQNVIPGITNRILARFVDKIAVGYQESVRYFSPGSQKKILVSGNPIRSEVMTATREEGVAALELSAQKRTVLISGGSRGARSINQAMLSVHRHFAGREDIQLLHVTGQSEYNNIVGNLKKYGIDEKNSGNIIIKPYLYNMPQALACCDLAIFRAGAIGLAELTARGIPAILVPYPYAAENHQEHNARAVEHSGAAVVIRDNELNGDKLIAVIERIMGNTAVLSDMAVASKALGRPEAAVEIARAAVNLAAGKHS
ncbi:undecaprenyldiphospho-muramoylpentapeptide beta-N-acetylglucosaminyltransferase [Propionispora hippei]|uniref:UDP-N-acetylglucosamine--N-acetylmuramyl-(pentapeptide) pyrophosphoryl-undecaprenol N-acetylglucosamine transferase n=1 Tax=Propionispora hippei DSM 15287 TaxID=1123003 RepID=A0A1M6AAP9_9FIRM|nr:undecaprenyldiphospho-muramoylpentapeptide beta-N-acetylglucosaminyltransferase [Propionispora hippei]SHI33507.1 UDP-N-acetylglucosamine-N-acetylmuramylpentapeptide N-acetylglucosamine transferase [Propionispora hippei DSM 15287]